MKYYVTFLYMPQFRWVSSEDAFGKMHCLVIDHEGVTSAHITQRISRRSDFLKSLKPISKKSLTKCVYLWGVENNLHEIL